MVPYGHWRDQHALGLSEPSTVVVYKDPFCTRFFRVSYRDGRRLRAIRHASQFKCGSFSSESEQWRHVGAVCMGANTVSLDVRWL